VPDAVRGDFCPACGVSVLAAAESSRVSAAMLEFNKQVNGSIVDPAFIARVRKKLALDPRQAAAIFGGGPNAFSRYENGKTRPPLALVKLLIVLDRHPNRSMRSRPNGRGQARPAPTALWASPADSTPPHPRTVTSS